MQHLPQAEAEQVKLQAQKWLKLLDEHYPEFKAIDCETASHKHSEAPFERNVADIRRSALC